MQKSPTGRIDIKTLHNTNTLSYQAETQRLREVRLAQDKARKDAAYGFKPTQRIKFQGGARGMEGTEQVKNRAAMQKAGGSNGGVPKRMNTRAYFDGEDHKDLAFAQIKSFKEDANKVKKAPLPDLFRKHKTVVINKGEVDPVTGEMLVEKTNNIMYASTTQGRVQVNPPAQQQQTVVPRKMSKESNSSSMEAEGGESTSTRMSKRNKQSVKEKTDFQAILAQARGGGDSSVPKPLATASGASKLPSRLSTTQQPSMEQPNVMASLLEVDVTQPNVMASIKTSLAGGPQGVNSLISNNTSSLISQSAMMAAPIVNQQPRSPSIRKDSLTAGDAANISAVNMTISSGGPDSLGSQTSVKMTMSEQAKRETSTHEAKMIMRRSTYNNLEECGGRDTPPYNLGEARDV